MEVRRKLLNSAKEAILYRRKCLAYGEKINIDFKMDFNKTMDVIQLHLLKIEV